MKTELTEREMLDLGWQKQGDVYCKEEDGLIATAKALPNGNAPIGGDHYDVKRSNYGRD